MNSSLSFHAEKLDHDEQEGWTDELDSELDSVGVVVERSQILQSRTVTERVLILDITTPSNVGLK